MTCLHGLLNSIFLAGRKPPTPEPNPTTDPEQEEEEVEKGGEEADTPEPGVDVTDLASNR